MTRFIAAAVFLLVAAQARTTRDGVYSSAQATQGERIYGMACATCHAPDLSGSGQAPALADADFAKEWDQQPLSDLFDRIRTTMPADAPGTLEGGDVAAVMAFLLKKAGMPAGDAELPADATALKSIAYSVPKAPRR